MINSISTQELEARMRPSQWSRFGFLGPNESLVDVITHDELALAQLGVAHGNISDAIDEIISEARSQRDALSYDQLNARLTDFPVLGWPKTVPSFSLGNFPDISKGFCVRQFQVFITWFLGYQNCPWGCPSAKGDFDFMILNRKTGESFAAPALITHLIKSHHFFEGMESPYRLEPEAAVRTLELAQKQAG
jgi:hypothetical protein